MSPAVKAVKAQHWYFIYYYDCPICGLGVEERERRYGPRPEYWGERHKTVTRYDYCDQ